MKAIVEIPTIEVRPKKIVHEVPIPVIRGFHDLPIGPPSPSIQDLEREVAQLKEENANLLAWFRGNFSGPR